ncbi:MAG: CHAP domain-containing protein [Nannocystaceae bacterium]
MVPTLALTLTLAAASLEGIPTSEPAATSMTPATSGAAGSALAADPVPATKVAARVLALLGTVAAGARETRYEHRTKIRARDGIFVWDCSAMAAWVLRKAAPTARSALTRERPVARDFYEVIRRAPLRGHALGWQRIGHITDVRPGDVFAWKRPKDFPSKNTGHVGFVLEAPTPAPGWEDAYLVRIADATSLPHQDDTRDPEGDGGYGEGTLLVLTDGAGQGIAYGWFGARSRGVIETPIAFGRLLR